MPWNKLFKTPLLKSKVFCKVMSLRNKEKFKGKEYTTENMYMSHIDIMKLRCSLKHSAAKAKNINVL